MESLTETSTDVVERGRAWSNGVVATSFIPSVRVVSPLVVVDVNTASV